MSSTNHYRCEFVSECVTVTLQRGIPRCPSCWARPRTSALRRMPRGHAEHHHACEQNDRALSLTAYACWPLLPSPSPPSAHPTAPRPLRWRRVQGQTGSGIDTNVFFRISRGRVGKFCANPRIATRCACPARRFVPRCVAYVPGGGGAGGGGKTADGLTAVARSVHGASQILEV